MGTSWVSDGIGQNINNTRDKPVFLLFRRRVLELDVVYAATEREPQSDS